MQKPAKEPSKESLQFQAYKNGKTLTFAVKIKHIMVRSSILLVLLPLFRGCTSLLTPPFQNGTSNEPANEPLQITAHSFVCSALVSAQQDCISLLSPQTTKENVPCAQKW